MIQFKNVAFTYDFCRHNGHAPNTDFSLNDVSFCLDDGIFLGITGPIGCGKTTLCKLIAGLLKPTSGHVQVPARVGFAMQFPENQLFARTVLEDVMFGPRNLHHAHMHATSTNPSSLATHYLSLVGLDSSFYSRNPLFLSGGEKRRVAIAGILAMESDILVLDEPTVGLDPLWHDTIYDILHNLNALGKTIIVVSHSLDDIAENCNQILLMDQGHILDFGPVSAVFSRHSDLQTSTQRLAQNLANLGLPVDPSCSLTVHNLVTQIRASLSSKIGCTHSLLSHPFPLDNLPPSVDNSR